MASTQSRCLLTYIIDIFIMFASVRCLDVKTIYILTEMKRKQNKTCTFQHLYWFYLVVEKFRHIHSWLTHFVWLILVYRICVNNKPSEETPFDAMSYIFSSDSIHFRSCSSHLISSQAVNKWWFHFQWFCICNRVISFVGVI